MARKQSMEASISSSDGEEFEKDDVEEEQLDNSVEGEEEDEENEEEDEEEEKSSVKKSAVSSAKIPPTKSHSDSGSGSDTESDAESDADSEQTLPSPNVSDFKIKPISSKPMNDSIKFKETEPKLSKKRVLEAELIQNESKSKKNKIPSNDDEEDGGGVEETPKKGSGVQRLWSFDDEVAILKGMVDYQSKKGSDPWADMAVFHEFIKKSLHVDVSKNQLMDKIRRLKKKYHQGNNNNGEDPVYSKPHEIKSFELSKKIWGSNGEGGGGKNNKSSNVVAEESSLKNKRKQRNSSNNSNASNVESILALPIQEAGTTASVKKQKVDVPNGKVEVVRVKEEEIVDSFESDFPHLSEELEGGRSLNVMTVGKTFMKERLSLVESSKVEELEKKWKKLKMEQLEINLMRLDLIHEQTKLVLDAMKNA